MRRMKITKGFQKRRMSSMMAKKVKEMTMTMKVMKREMTTTTMMRRKKRWHPHQLQQNVKQRKNCQKDERSHGNNFVLTFCSSS